MDHMRHTKYYGYGLALATSVAYAIWYLGSNAVMAMSDGLLSPIFSLFLIEIVSSLIVLLAGRSRIWLRLDQLPYPVVSGALFALGNYIFYVTIANNGLAPASAFASAEIVIFTAILALSSRYKQLIGLYFAGTALIAGGMVMESLTLSGQTLAFSTSVLGTGVALAFIYGIATYFYYLSTKKIENPFAVMFPIQFTEVILFGIALAVLLPSVQIPHLGAAYVTLIIVVGVVLMLSFYLETLVLKVLTPFGRGAVATGYALSDLQLLPVIIFVLVAVPSTWTYNVPGLLFITVGMLLLEWK
jgi:hypothetical protein